MTLQLTINETTLNMMALNISAYDTESWNAKCHYAERRK